MEDSDTEKRDFGDETFRVTGEDLVVYASCVFLASIVPILLWGMATEEMAKTLFGDPEWWGIWTEPGGVPRSYGRHADNRLGPKPRLENPRDPLV